MTNPEPAVSLSAEEVRKVARLARLALPEAHVARLRAELSAVLGYVERLRELDLAGVEPLTHVGDGEGRPAPDEPGATLPTEAAMRLAPEPSPPFFRVPKVLDGGSGA